MCKSAKIPFLKVDDPHTAMTVRASCLTMKKAVIRTLRSYGRGYDVKFLSESIVCVFTNGSTLTKDELYQMIGRSSRNQGTFRGAIFMLDNNFVGAEQSWTNIQTRSAAKPTSFIANLRTLYSIAETAETKDI
jgi:hypothetical protein